MGQADIGKIAFREVARVDKWENGEQVGPPDKILVTGIGQWYYKNENGDPVYITEAETINKLEVNALLDAVNGVVRALLSDDIRDRLTPIIEAVITKETLSVDDYRQLSSLGFPALDITAEMLGMSTQEAQAHLEASGIPRQLFTVLIQEWAVHRNMIQSGA